VTSWRRLTLPPAMTLLLAVAACEAPIQPVIGSLPPLPEVSSGEATPRINGPVGGIDPSTAPLISYGQTQPLTLPPNRTDIGGDISLDFADTDIREVVAQILGGMLRVNYTIDPAVRGTATLHTSRPVASSQLLSVLQGLLAQNNATLLQNGSIYRVVPASASAGGGAAPGGSGPTGAGNLTNNDALSGSVLVPLRYASAEDLAKVLQPFAGNGARVVAEPGRNALLVGGDPAARGALISLIQAFDIDLLAGQSYALFSASSGDAKDFATSLQDAFRTQGALAGVVRVVPMARLNSVLVIASQQRYIEDARRVYALMDRSRRGSVRGWHVYYLQNSHSDEAAYVLQQAFTPGNVTAQPGGSSGQGGNQRQQGAAAQNGSALGTQGITGGGLGNGGNSNGTLGGGGASGLGGSPGGQAIGGSGGSSGGLLGGLASGNSPSNQSNPLFGGLDPTGGGGADPNAMRIIPNPQNNALLVYATPRENDTVEAMLRKIDILPLQVRIDATIAEVTLNDQLQYGTQFFFKAGGINGILNNAVGAVGSPVTTVLGTTFPGFVIGGNGQGGAPLAISALQAVTTVHVLSSPEIMVLDNQPARLQVGNLVPYLTQSSQSTLSSNPPIINSIAYQPTGVIMEVTPRINSGGLVTIDVAQQVSDVDTTSPKASGIDSPTFLQRSITSRVVVQDGQTIGLAGLIRDSSSRGNAGIPWLKDIPILGFLAGTQSVQRARTELLVLITPHVVQDQRSARALTQDMRDQLSNAAAVPEELKYLKPSGSNDHNQRTRRAVRLQP
jgi:general secretion pathway protein D